MYSSPSESLSLLVPAGLDSEGLNEHSKDDTPLPKKQLLILCLIAFSDLACYRLIFPFINEMIESIGIRNPGYASGLVGSAYAIAHMCTAYYWGALSDRVGRRPILLFELFCIACITLTFGLSVNLLMILTLRLLNGAVNASAVILRSSVADITDESNQGRALSLLMMSWGISELLAYVVSL